jgi:4-hydroxy-3-methylbut-2-enyl diphosphate reductase IspH
MTIDERLERLADRHEALAQSVELLLVATRENTENIRKLVEVSNRDAESIRSLARIAESHERRITDL